ncbi:hypothetical protein [Halalkalibacter akibai]|uniref:HD-GYP hydrolase domain containing protein n=1 Tax=Halalkalibacter akibai (strain ATCC 43226 / DSM 21942 / CIP 109018 / JCM 9157 / 1139) TaxID=1236973 RepID=W4QMT8_HALA3|nr:hypothetical protein [Halalkalibacter akibai]GAE33232.1 HD-GYP hydrolase domain containing protein [Halalkalibacter akibai JCM 9157]
MRLVSIRSIISGTKLAKPIYNDNGQVLLFEGAELTERVLDRLTQLGFSFLYVQDSQTDDIVVENVITEETKRKAIKTIKDEFIAIADELKLKKTFNADHLSKDFGKVVQLS